MQAGYKGLVIAGVVLGLCLPLVAEQGNGGGRERKQGGEREHARLSEEGRAIMRAHREQQREQMKARMEAHREAQKQRRAAVQAETDPYRQLDLMEANVRARQRAMAKRREEARQAHLVAFAQALGASGIEGTEREQILGRMLATSQDRQAAGDAHGEAVLAEIARLRAMPDLTTEAIREVCQLSMMQHRKGRRTQGEDRGRRNKKVGASPQADAL